MPASWLVLMLWLITVYSQDLNGDKTQPGLISMEKPEHFFAYEETI